MFDWYYWQMACTCIAPYQVKCPKVLHSIVIHLFMNLYAIVLIFYISKINFFFKLWKVDEWVQKFLEVKYENQFSKLFLVRMNFHNIRCHREVWQSQETHLQVCLYRRTDRQANHRDNAAKKWSWNPGSLIIWIAAAAVEKPIWFCYFKHDC